MRGVNKAALSEWHLHRGLNNRDCTHRGHTSYLSQAPQAVPVEKNSAMWRNFRLNAEIVPFKCGENLSHGEISPHEKCGDKSVNIMCTIFDVLSHFMLFCCKIFLLCDLRCFVAKSVLLWFGNVVVCKRALAWRKIEPKKNK